MDILWPRWVARIGVTRATEACFLTADRQCTELPLLRLPRLYLIVPQARRVSPLRPPRPSAGGLEGDSLQGRAVYEADPRSLPQSSPSGHMSGHASQVRFRAWVRRAGHPPGRSTSDTKSGRYVKERAGPSGYASSAAPSEGGGELRGPHGRLISWRRAVLSSLAPLGCCFLSVHSLHDKRSHSINK